MKYAVEIRRKKVEKTLIEVEANSDFEASAKALEISATEETWYEVSGESESNYVEYLDEIED